MRRQGITQGDIDRARKSEEAKILADAQGAKGKGEDLNAKDNIGACLVSVFLSKIEKNQRDPLLQHWQLVSEKTVGRIID